MAALQPADAAYKRGKVTESFAARKLFLVAALQPADAPDKRSKATWSMAGPSYGGAGGSCSELLWMGRIPPSRPGRRAFVARPWAGGSREWMGRNARPRYGRLENAIGRLSR